MDPSFFSKLGRRHAGAAERVLLTINREGIRVILPTLSSKSVVTQPSCYRLMQFGGGIREDSSAR